MHVPTADLCDAHPGELQVAEPILRDFGGARGFSGAIVTVQVHDDNVLVRHALNHPGEGRVLVVDNEGSLRCALVGDQLGQMAGKGRHGVTLRFAGVSFEPGAWVYADEDGLVVAARKLEIKPAP